MAPWLTFVVGIILGLLIGWLIDLLYRRAPRPSAESPEDRAPEWAQPVSVDTAAPELPAVAAASAGAVAAVAGGDARADAQRVSETAEATGETVNWREISVAVDEAAAEAEPPAAPSPRIESELPEEAGLPPSVAEVLAPPPAEDEPPEEES